MTDDSNTKKKPGIFWPLMITLCFVLSSGLFVLFSNPLYQLRTAPYFSSSWELELVGDFNTGNPDSIEPLCVYLFETSHSDAELIRRLRIIDRTQRAVIDHGLSIEGQTHQYLKLYKRYKHSNGSVLLLGELFDEIERYAFSAAVSNKERLRGEQAVDRLKELIDTEQVPTFDHIVDKYQKLGFAHNNTIRNSQIRSIFEKKALTGR